MTVDKIFASTISNRILVSSMMTACVFGLLLPIFNISPPQMISRPGEFVESPNIGILGQKIEDLNKKRSAVNLTEAERKTLDKEISLTTNSLIKTLTKNERAQSYGLASTRALLPFPDALNYDAFSLSEPIPRLFVSRMPAVDALDIQKRKRQFVQVLLPLILQSNEEIISHRTAIKTAIAADDGDILKAFAKKYRVDENLPFGLIVAELEKKVQLIPVEIALAQAAIESGWGQSRFTHQGNALFGQWVWNLEKGIKPINASNKRAAVRAFPDLLSSVRAYMLNLNTHFAYEAFREHRHELLSMGEVPISGLKLVPFLSQYAETGHEYVETLTRMISQNRFDRLARRRLL